MSGFQDYSEFLSVDQIQQIRKKSYSGSSFEKNITPVNIDAMLKKKFQPTKYPIDPLSANLFCPICGKQVKQADQCSVYVSDTYRRNFLAHDLCLTREDSRLLNDLFDNIEEMILTPAVLPKKGPTINLSDREFCLQLSISHPLSDFSFMKIVTKKTLESNTLRWQFKQHSQQGEQSSGSFSFSYHPNILGFPFIDFNIGLTYSEIGVADSKKIFKNYVNLSRMKLQSVSSLIAAYMQDQFKIQLNIYKTLEQKIQLIKQMNYKYKFSEHIPTPIVELVAIEVTVPEEYENYEDYYEESNRTITELISDKQEDNVSSYHSSYHSSAFGGNQGNNYENFDSVSVNNSVNSAKLIVYPPTRELDSPVRDKKKGKDSSSLLGITKNIGGNSANNSANTSIMAQKQKVDLEKLMATNKLSSYVRNNTQSRIFQNFLAEQANFQQVQQIIHHLYQEIPDLITDEYANYMVQKLFQVSLPPQRILILTRLYEDIPDLVRNKQGTHTVQTFLDYLHHSPEEYKLVCSAIEKDFQQLCLHPISTHFIQKIIKSFPLENTLYFFNIANQNFLKFATDQNAMCVLKYMLRKIKQFDGNPLVFEIKKHFINSITFTTDKIIQDRFGNYVVQFCYELFGQSKSSGITQMILQKFAVFSVQKFSSSVILKCINTYWTDRGYVNRLKDTLKSDGIFQMFRNREGNKILLDLMDKNENTLLREKILTVLANGQPTKFYHDRWGIQSGVRSGPVGMEFKSFTEADAHQSKKNPSNASKKSKKK